MKISYLLLLLTVLFVFGCSSIGTCGQSEYRLTLPNSVPLINGDFVLTKKKDGGECVGNPSAPEST